MVTTTPRALAAASATSPHDLERVSISLPRAHVNQLRSLREQHGVPQSQFVRWSVRHALAQMEAEGPATVVARLREEMPR